MGYGVGNKGKRNYSEKWDLSGWIFDFLNVHIRNAKDDKKDLKLYTIIRENVRF